MPERELDLEILRGGRHVTEISALANPDDTEALQEILTKWLAGDGWAKGRWTEFELMVRHQGEYRIRRKIRAGGD